MLRPMFGHRAKPKKFDIPLRYYDPKEDEKRRQRLRIQTDRRRHHRQNMRILVYALALGLIVWIISLL